MRDSSSAKLRIALLSVALFATVLALAYAASSRFSFPNYGAWTGIQPLETKIGMLEDFARRGEVDALALGSSIVEFGFNAEEFSALMTRETGKEFRAFNFASGGAQLRTLPKLYRLARTVSKPKNVFVIVPLEPKLVEKLVPQSPDLILSQAPVSDVLYHPFLLSLNWFLRQTPPIRNSPAVRDLALYGDFHTLQGKIGMEAYHVDDFGDRISYLVTWKADDLPKARGQLEDAARPYPAAATDAVADSETLQKRGEFYLARRDIDAIRELRELVEKDGGKVYVFTHGAAASYWNGGLSTKATYRKGRSDYFDTVAALFGAKLFDPAPQIDVELHAVSDVTHLNTYGASAYTRAAFAVFAGKPGLPIAEPIRRPPVETLFPTQDRSFTPYSALLLRPAGRAHPLLHFRLVKSLAVPAIPPGDQLAALRTPDNVDLLVIAHEIGPGDYVAEFNLPPSDRPEAYMLRVVTGTKGDLRAYGNPIADYEWLDGYPRLVARSESRPPGVQMAAFPPSRTAGESLYLAFDASKPLPPMLDVKLSPTQPGAVSFDLGKVQRADGLIKVAIPAKLDEGPYTVEVRDAASGMLVAISRPIQVMAREEPVTVAVDGTPHAADGTMVVTWAGLRRDGKQDWIGLFPAGGKDESRLAFQFTNGKRSGKFNFAVPQGVASQPEADFELRLYIDGGWRLIGRSDPFKFVPGKSEAAQATAAASVAAAAPVAASAPEARPPSNAKVTVDPNSPIANRTLRVSWSGIEKPNAQDWIGLFPVDGADTTRLAFQFLPGTTKGDAVFNVPPDFPQRLAAGDYEIRLFSAGRWELLARSDRIRLAATRDERR